MANTLEQIIGGEAALNSAIGLDPKQIEAIAMIGYQAYEQGRGEEAKTIFEGLTALDANSYYGYAGLGAISLADEKLLDAIELLKKATELQPADATVHANLGEAYLRNSELDKASEQFRAALTLDSTGSDPGANRARALLQGMQIVLNEVEKSIAS